MSHRRNIKIFIMGCLQLDKSTCLPILKKKEKTLSLLYLNCVSLMNLSAAKKIIIIKYEGIDRLIPSSISMMFAPALSGGIKALAPDQTKKMSKKKFYKCANKKMRKDIYFILRFMDYMHNIVDNHNKDLYPIMMKYLTLLSDCKTCPYPMQEKVEVDSDSPFIHVSRLTKGGETQFILKSDEEKLKKLESKFLKEESKIITKLDLVSVLGVIPN